MSWNYRVVRRTGKHPTYGDWEELGIHEVYYDAKDNPESVTTKPVAVCTDEDIDGIKWQLARMAEACDKPVLNYEEIGEDDSADS